MIDIVVNHNGWPGPQSSVDYSRFNPFNNAGYYHNYCPIDNYNDQGKVEGCWLGDNNVMLPDLKTEDSIVAGMYQSWIKGLVAEYSSKWLKCFEPVRWAIEYMD